MQLSLSLSMEAQPDDLTCGPTCLHAVYGYYGDAIDLSQVIAEVRALDGGGTLAVFLACHALCRGYEATIVTYNVQLFDPTWFEIDGIDIPEKLRAQAAFKTSDRLRAATAGYLNFLKLGGRLRSEDLTCDLIRGILDSGSPILTGLSSTFLYRAMREVPATCEDDDVAGEPVGHFVVLTGYDLGRNEIVVADPLQPNPVSEDGIYRVDLDRAINAILLGVLTHDANLLVLRPHGRG